MFMRATERRFIACPTERAVRRRTPGPKLDMREWPGIDSRLTRIDRQLVYFDELRSIAFDQYRTYAHQARDVTKGPTTRAKAILRRKRVFRALAHIAEMKLKLARQRHRLITELAIVFH
jgi:hypothetical protein